MERFEQFSNGISEISRYWHKIAAGEMAKYGLKATHSTYLVALLGAKEGLTAPQICERCGKDKSDVSRMMKILIEKELVYKDGEFQNRYGGRYKLTETGIQSAEKVREIAGRAVEIAGADLTEEQRNTFYYALESIVIHLREMSEKGLLDQ